MAIVYFLCGLPTSGKTTFAKKLELENGAIRLTLDARMISKYDYSIFDEEYGRLAAKEKQIMWEEAQVILDQGGDIVLDWSLWSQKARIEWSQKVLAAGYEYQLIYLDVSLNVLRQRSVKRNVEAPPETHFIDVAELERFSKIFEPPTSAENLRLQIIPTY